MLPWIIACVVGAVGAVGAALLDSDDSDDKVKGDLVTMILKEKGRRKQKETIKSCKLRYRTTKIMK